MRIVLASRSPRRKELLEQIGVAFEILVSHVDEQITETEPGKVVEELSFQKADAVLSLLDKGKEDILVIGSDTVVSVDGEILGKPTDREDAVRMLSMLSGRSHEVYTGVTLLYFCQATGQVTVKCFYEMTKVNFYEMSEAEIAAYVDSRDPMDKAGAYGIQGYCARYIRGIEGDYNTVVGLPVGRLYQEGKEWFNQ